jgi:hypothetical protein
MTGKLMEYFNKQPRIGVLKRFILLLIAVPAWMMQQKRFKGRQKLALISSSSLPVPIQLLEQEPKQAYFSFKILPNHKAHLIPGSKFRSRFLCISYVSTWPVIQDLCSQNRYIATVLRNLRRILRERQLEEDPTRVSLSLFSHSYV